ncbi:MAG TPA: beta-ketoacyl-[acyl-carrier-protein] synthase family protein [Nitrospirota bacterium]|nr:beta-ketoacyl-[acyl-carrier-protein] synthase family protein [Nitrospirota bacterium]
MNKRIVITGLGVISSIGIGWRDFWDNLLKGKSGISPITSFDTTNQFTHNGGEVKNFRPEDYLSADQLKSFSRATQLAFASAHLAMKDATLSPADLSTRTAGVCVGTTMGSIQTVEIINELLVTGRQKTVGADLIRQTSTHSTSAAIAREFSMQGANFMFSTACAAGNYAIGYGLDLIRLGRADVLLAGGAEPLSKVAFTGFNQFSAVAPERCQPFDSNRKGMMVAEGSAFVVLESLESALSRNVGIYAEVLGYGLSCDAYHMTTSSTEGIVACMSKAMEETGIAPEQVDYISAHGTGTLTNDRNESAAIKEVFGHHYKRIPVSSIKSMLGHTMGAASAIEAIACALSVKTDTIPPTINYETPDIECDIDCVPNQSRKHTVTIALNNSYAFGGNNACLVLKKFTG